MTGRLIGNILNTTDGHKFYRQKSNALKSKLYFRCTQYRSGCTAIVHTGYSSNSTTPRNIKIIHRAGSHNHSPTIYPKMKEEDELNSELATESENNESMEDEETDDDEVTDGSIDLDAEDEASDEDDDEDDEDDEEDDGNTIRDGLMVLYYYQFLNHLEDYQLHLILERLTSIEMGSIRIAFNCYKENQDQNFKIQPELLLNLQNEHTNISYFIDGVFSRKSSIDFLKSDKIFAGFKQLIAHLCGVPSLVLAAVLNCP